MLEFECVYSMHIYLYVECLCIVQCSAVQTEYLLYFLGGGGKSMREVDNHDGELQHTGRENDDTECYG